MGIKLVAIDLDGTLLHDDMSISSYSKNVLKKIQNAGIRIVVATGRMFSAARLKTAELDLGDVPVICYTGAWIMTNQSGKELMKKEIPTDVVGEIVRAARKNNWLAYTFYNDISYLPKPHEREKCYEKYRAEKTQYLGDDFYYPTENSTRVIFADSSEKVRKEIRTFIEENFSSDVEVFFPGDDFVDVHRKGVSKGNALSFLCEIWKIKPEEMAAFGNTENDVSMLQMAGYSWAVSNADDVAKKAAKYICPSNNEDGVAQILETFLDKIKESHI